MNLRQFQNIALQASFFAICSFVILFEAQAQTTVYSVDFDSETPVNQADLCDPVYTPPSGKWELGEACAPPSAGTPEFEEVAGDTYLKYNRQYPANSIVWLSSAIDVSGEDALDLSIDLLSYTAGDNTAANDDRLELFLELDGVMESDPFFEVSGHVDGSDNSVAIAAYSLNQQIDVSGASSVKLVIQTKLVGPAAAYLFDDIMFQTVVDPCDDPIVLLDANSGLPYDASDVIVECMEDLPDACDEDVVASRGDLACIYAEQRQTRTVCSGTTALGTGDDGAIVLFDVNGDPLDDRYYVPTSTGITLTQYENGIAIVSGQVADVDNANAIFDLSIVYTDGVSGADWAGGFKVNSACMATTDITDEWTIYLMDGNMSYLQGQGDLDGSLLVLQHAPSSEYFGFQVGEMANDRNCNFGAGGWFSYSGTINGEEIQGAQGDLLLDLNCSELSVDPCGDPGPSVTLQYTVIDLDCGDASTTTQVITRDDTTDPEFDNAPGDVTLSCADDVPAAPTVTASDNCNDPGFPTVTYLGESTIPGSCPHTYTLIRQWMAMDCSGNNTGHTQTITVQDTEAPVISNGMDMTVECDGAGNTAALAAWVASKGGATATDNCGSVTWTDDYPGSLSDDCGATGTITVTFTATDECSNSSDITLDFTIEDTTDPSIDVEAADQTVECDGAGNTAAFTSWLSSNGGAAASDLCGSVTWSNNSTGLSDDCGATGSETVTFTATDDCGNTSTTTATFTIEDTTAPVWNEYTIYQYASCDEVLDPEDPTMVPITAAEDCGDVTYTVEAYQLSGGCPGTWMRIWTATDDCGNASEEIEQYLELYDIVKPVPVITCPEDYTTTVDENCVANTDTSMAGVATAVVTDNCDPDVDYTITYADGDTSSTCEGQYSFVRTWTVSAMDHCDNEETASCMQTITVNDETSPTIGTEAMNMTVECDGSGNTAALSGWLSNNAGAMATDNCSSVTWSHDFSALSDDCGATGSAMVMFTATDDCGNTSTTTATFTIEDTTPPVITGEPIDTVACDAFACDAATLIALGVVSVGDACGDATLAAECTPYSGPCVEPYDYYEITYTATDDCGLTSTLNQVIRLIDEEDPVVSITCPEDYSTSFDDACSVDLSPSFAGSPTTSATDNCDDDPEIETSYTDGSSTPGCGSSYSFVRTWTATATDNCGNSSSATCNQTITVTDDTDPVIDCPEDVTVECDGAGNAADLAAFLAGASATDNCDNDVDITHDYTGLSDDCGATGSATVTFTATDDCGNTASCSATFTIEDTTDPTIDIAAADETVECDGAGNTADLAAWLANNGGATASDDCSDLTWVNNYEDCGLDAGDFLTYNQGAGSTPGFGDATSSIASDYLDANFASVFPEGVTTGCAGGNYLLFTSADAVDTYLPCTGSAQDLVITASGTDPDENASDPTCFDNALVTHLLVAKINVGFDAANPAYSASDLPLSDLVRNSGPFAGYTVAEIIQIADEVLGGCRDDFSPNQARKAVRDLNQNFDSGIDLGRFYLPGCSTIAEMSDDCGATGSVTVTFTAFDDCGNSSETSATFTIEDTTNPSIDTAAADETVECDGAGNTAAYAAWLANNGGAAASDLCGGVTWSNNSVGLSDDCGATGSETVTFTATDDCGNTSTTMATFTIEDTTDPTIDTAAADETVECDGAGNAAAFAAWLANNGGAAASDLCGGVTWSNNSAGLSDDCGATGSETVTFTATDDCGNTSTTMATFTIEDTTDPTLTITGPDDVSVSQNATCDLDTSEASLGTIMYTAMDDCGGVSVDITYTDSEVVYTCECEEEEDGYTFDACRIVPGDFRTQTVGGWGQNNCNGGNAACYRDANFATAFPAGVSIGCAGGESLTFTTSEAVAIFLPCGGPAGALDASATNPTCVSNNLAGQLLAAKLSLGFDAADPDFGSAPVSATLLVLDEGPYEGSTIADVVALADEVLGGCTVANASNLVSALTTFNEGFVGGTNSTDKLRLDDCEELTPDPCDGNQEGTFTFVRSFTVVATDDCNNETTDTYDQTITITDDMAPVFTEDCGYDNGDVESVCCESADGMVTIPDPCAVEALDNCDSEVDIECVQSYSGMYAPWGTIDSYCTSTTPEAFADDETCSGGNPHSLVLFNFDDEDKVEFVASEAGVIEQTESGLWSMTQAVTREDGGNGGFVIHVTYGEALDWDAWSNQDFPTGYKRDCGNILDDHENWDYRVMQSGLLIGTGDYDGIELDLAHAPTHLYYAFQIGFGANNQNENYGYGGWIGASGEIDGEDVFFSGDIFGDLDCCLPWSVTRTYTATDDCGNENMFSYTIDVNGEECDDTDGDAGLSGGQVGDHTPVILGGSGDLTTGKTPIRVTNLQPNPTNDWSLLGFTVTENMRLRVDMYAMDGTLVAELFDGVASSNVNHTLDVPAQDLDAGMYQIRLSSSQYLVVKKLLVTQ